MKSDVARICLGTAQFTNHYGATNTTGQPSYKEVTAIIACAHEAGICFADTASSYHWLDFPDGWNVVYKVRPDDINTMLWWYGAKGIPFYALLSHEPAAEHLVRAIKAAGYKGKIGQSVYHPETPAGWADVFQFPLNLADRRYADLYRTHQVFMARSVFLQGKLLEMGYSVSDCLGYVLRQPVDYAIVGVNSVKELEEIIRAAEGLPEHVPDIPAPQMTADELDPRTWK